MKHFSSLMRGWPAAALLIFLLLAGHVAQAQAPAWQTAMCTTQNTSSNSSIAATATDASGNVYLAGSFIGAVTFGATTLTNSNDYDIFVAKWSPVTMNFVWAQQAGGAGNDYAYAIAVNGPNVYAAGTFGGTGATFGSTTLNNTASLGNLFVTKLTDTGTAASFVWAQQSTNTRIALVTAVAVSGTSLYITGTFFGSTAGFGNVLLTATGSNPNATDIFVAKLTDAGLNGNFAWATRAGGTDLDYANALAISGTSLYIVGRISSVPADFGTTTLAPAGSYDAFVAKLTDTGSAGTFDWARQAGGAGWDEAHAVATNGTSVYVTGEFNSPVAAFGTATLANAGSAPSNDVFLTKLTDTGVFVWAQQAGGTGYDMASAVAVVGRNVYIAGGFGSAIAIFGSTTLTNSGNNPEHDVFITKLTDGGTAATFAWAQRGGGASRDEANSLVISGTHIYVSGYVSPPASFGNLALTSPGIYNTAFLASLTDPTLLANTSPTLSGTAFTLAPNPARAATTVTLPALPALPGTATLTLRDALGRTLRTATVALPPAGLRHEFDLSNLPAGIYALQVQAGAATATRRLVVD